jgi:hypothetical protein
MHIKSLFLIVSGALLLNSCKPSGLDYFTFDPRTLKENEIALSDIADGVTYLPLPNNFPVGKASKFNFIDQSVYFLSGDGIIAFDREENQLRRIGSKGRGPGEYLYSRNFTVDEKTGTVYVLDQGDIVKTYSKTGEFLKSIPLQKFGISTSIDFFESALFVTYAFQFGGSLYSWVIFDTSGNVIKKREIGIPAFSGIYGNSRATYKYGSKIYYWNNYIDTVFSVLPDLSVDPSFFIRPGEHRIPRTRDTPLNPNEKYMTFSSIFETKRYIVIQYYFMKTILLLYDKFDKESFLINLEYEKNTYINGIENDLDAGPEFLPYQYTSENGREYMVGVIDPINIKTIVSSDKFKKSVPKYPEKKKVFEKLANSLKETDNPVLVLVRLKK